MEILSALKKFKRPFKCFIVIFALTGVLSALFTPAPSGYPPRAKVSAMIASAKNMQFEIERMLKSGENPSKIDSISLKENKYISYNKVSSDGEIIMYSEEIGAIVILTPKLNENEIIWRCQVQPNKYAPTPCKEKRS